ncbi:60S ribosomal protein L11-1 [Zea mays]|uniref:60S ribosomal protein L11-1 n=1 Tax=Zea mays TaxID=4577 RepID=A0A1D6EFP0_MAIZE|nr:60S ribosomal protein L11-1 [Zea mays]
MLNISIGESGDRLTRTAKVLEQLSGQSPQPCCDIAARYTMRSFGIRRNEKITCYVTALNCTMSLLFSARQSMFYLQQASRHQTVR